MLRTAFSERARSVTLVPRGPRDRVVGGMAFLVVIDGDHRRQVDLHEIEVTVGRGADCDVVLPGDQTLSRRHLTLRSTEEGWTVTDLGSRNGSFVNGRRVESTRLLGRDDRVLLGQYVLLVRTDEATELETVDGSAPMGKRLYADLGLSPREVDVVRLVCSGMADQAIADELFVSVKTVHSHLDRIGQKTGHRRRPELVRFALEHGLA